MIDETAARTLCTIARQFLDGCCADPPEHLNIELAAIAVDGSLSEAVRNEAAALLEEARA